MPAAVAGQMRRQRPEAAAFLEQWGEWEDEVERTVWDDFATGESREILRLGEEEVHLENAPLTVACGDRMRVRGLRLGQEVAGRMVALTPAPRQATACTTTGVQRVAIILLHFPGQALPSSVNATALRTALLGPGNSVDGYWREASFGLTSGAGDVLGPFTLSQNFSCAQTNQIRTAGIAAADASVDLRQYTRLVFVFPGNCGGLGTIGCRNNTSTRGSFTASVAWLGQDFSNSLGLATCALVHEIGHGMGLSHASSLSYGSRVLGALSEEGTHDEYGDRYSLMGLCFNNAGTYLLGHFAAPHKQKLGWFTEAQMQQVETSGTFTLTPYSQDSATLKALRIRRGVGNNRWVWLEFRQPVGYDATLIGYSAQVDDGPLGHYENPAEGGYIDYTRLLNFRAATDPGAFQQPALVAGQSWSDPFSELSIQVQTVTASGMTVRVNYDTPCATLSQLNPALGAGAGAASVTVTAAAGCTWAVSSNDSWLTVTSASSGSGNGAVNYSFTANSGVSPRAGSLSIGRQAYNVTQASSNSQPAVMSVAPAAGSAPPGTNVSYEAVFSDADGGTTLSAVNLWFSADSGQTNACRVEYLRGANQLRLYGDANGSWQFLSPGLDATMSNSQCQVNVASTTVVVSGTTLTLRLNVRFLTAFTGLKNIYGSATDTPGAGTASTLLGRVSVGNVNLTPTVTGVTPAGGTGSTATLALTFVDGNGAADLTVINVLIQDALDGRNSCYLAYVRSANILYLMNDAGSDLLPGLTLNGTGSLVNSRCTVAGAGTSATMNGTTLTLTLQLSFTAAHAGNRIVYAAARDVALANSGWRAVGVWRVPGQAVSSPAVDSLSPQANATASGTLTAVFSDAQGFGDLNVLNILINSALDGRNACYLAYVRSTNIVYLVNDPGDDLLPGVTPGGTGLTVNTQCSVLASGSSVTTAGNTLTLRLNLTMSSPAFRGSRVIYMAARDLGANNSGWQAVGTWDVP